jgi:hypothetical protein
VNANAGTAGSSSPAAALACSRAACGRNAAVVAGASSHGRARCTKSAGDQRRTYSPHIQRSFSSSNFAPDLPMFSMRKACTISSRVNRSRSAAKPQPSSAM